jgi:hypothetical protein
MGASFSISELADADTHPSDSEMGKRKRFTLGFQKNGKGALRRVEIGVLLRRLGAAVDDVPLRIVEMVLF